MKSSLLMKPIKIVIICISCLCALSGIEHGFFEVLQGSIRTEIHNIEGRQFIYAIGESLRFWKYGYEYAYTIIPNYLITGIITICISIFLIYWSIMHIEKKLGWIIFIVLSILQYLTGGGAAQLGLAILIGIIASLVNRKFSILRKISPKNITSLLTNTWIYLLVLFIYSFLQTMITAIFGILYWIKDEEIIIKAQFSMIYIMLGLFILLIISTFYKTFSWYENKAMNSE